MINLKLWQLVSLALPMIVILLVQTVVMYFYASFVVFRLMGKDYDAATIASGRSVIHNADMIFRGYENLLDKLHALSVNAKLEET